MLFLFCQVYIKVGCKEVYITGTCKHDESYIKFYSFVLKKLSENEMLMMAINY